MYADSSEDDNEEDEYGTDNVEDTDDSGNEEDIRSKRQVNKARLNAKKPKKGRGKAQFKGLKFRGGTNQLEGRSEAT